MVPAFNNTLSMWIYEDDNYYTYHQAPNTDIDFPEAENYDGSTLKPIVLPQYVDIATSANVGQTFSPLVNPDDVTILYPGNNGCETHWHISDEDTSKYFLIGNTRYNWMRKSSDQTINYIGWIDDITPGIRDPTKTVHNFFSKPIHLCYIMSYTMIAKTPKLSKQINSIKLI